VDRDIPNLVKALASEGYYGAHIEGMVDSKAKPVHVIFRVDPGSLLQGDHFAAFQAGQRGF